MTETSWDAELLGATFESDTLTIRLDCGDGSDPDRSVCELRICGGGVSTETVAVLNDCLFYEIEVTLREGENERVVEIVLDHFEDHVVKIIYDECVIETTSYNIAELMARLRHREEKQLAESNTSWQEIRRLRAVIHRLQLELGKEMDRLTRKSEFFADTEKGARYLEELKCYEKVRNWLAHAEENELN